MQADLMRYREVVPLSKVHIELQRVQTWLFSVPRLRAMVGANALLGEVLRIELRELACRAGNWSLLPVSGKGYPSADPFDPLKDHDDPAFDAGLGILSRDGGHFEALFASGADAFADEAAALLRRELPGLRFRIYIDDVECYKSMAHLSTELPVFAPCQWAGRGLASEIIMQGEEPVAVSRDVATRHRAAQRAKDGKAADLASLLSATTKLKVLKRADELQELVGSGHLALIHADGNGIGRGAAGKTDSERAAFYHRNRVLLRRALREAINVHCPDEGQAPLIPLMLGGDDLLLVCRAEIGLPFVVTLCKALADLQKDGDGFQLTLGIGVVFAKHTIPIHRLHEVAEDLAGSAKRRFRGLQDAGEWGSVVDWAVYTTAWVDDPKEIRRRDWLRGKGPDLHVLSQRPVDVLGEGLHTLQGLLKGAAELANAKAPRSQLRYLVEQLSRGCALSELAFAELSKEARDALAKSGVKEIWRCVSDEGPWLTEILDLVEISEIARLGRSVERTRATGETAHVKEE